eukprot:1023365-Prorocentrum_minimum.AAC.1
MALMLDLHNQRHSKLVCTLTTTAHLAATVKLFADLKADASPPPHECVRRTLVALLLYLDGAEDLMK